MKKKILIVSSVSLLFFNALAGYCQEKVWPGQVATPYFWLQATKQGPTYSWDNKTNNKEVKLLTKSKLGGSYNFNPSITFDAQKDSIVAMLGSSEKKKYTLFVAYKVTDSLKEQVLWSLATNNKTTSLATNFRLANLTNFRYQSYPHANKPTKANIHFYQQHIADTLATTSVLTLGNKRDKERLPASNFKGELSEVLFYDRVLSGIESQKVISYLAIKYGISIADIQPNDYLNSKGQVIWDFKKHKGFTSDITAVGRDDKSGLLQLMSTNSKSEGLLTMALKSNTGNIPDKYFSFWSDNGKNLVLGKQDQGEPVGFSREWQLDYNNPTDLSLDALFTTSFFKGEIPVDQFYWLLVDYSGLGTYEATTSEYIKLGSTSKTKQLLLKNFNWDKQKTGKVRFKIKVAPQLFARVAITEALCGVSGSGKLNFEIKGGEGPFTITVKNEDTSTVVKQWLQTEKSDIQVAIASGKYSYAIRDQKGNLYSDVVFVADKNSVSAILDSAYVLKQDNPLYLDASQGLPAGNYTYEWYFEGNFVDDGPALLIRVPGDYELRIRKDNQCQSAHKISVTTDGSIPYAVPKVLLFPNPTTDGHFSIAMDYPQKTDVVVRIYTATGAFLSEKSYYKVDTQLHRESIKGAAGMYLVQVQSDFGTQVFKVIVK
ncbi:MAG: T9SS type A sorting domain-containing protein [Flavobacteriaceae bacterium]|jgi:hypothetical protein|nr:T9SS type A sorting domain-containing protein [Flavobacteriaceae bacterium]